VRAIKQYAEEGNISGLAEIVGDGAQAVPGANDVETTLVGELLNLLANGGVTLPEAHRTSYGILLTLDPAESAALEDGIDRFMQVTAEETLASDRSLILYSQEPDLVRRGIAYLRRGLKIPSGYDALLLLGR
jgi:hypothetical protein